MRSLSLKSAGFLLGSLSLVVTPLSIRADSALLPLGELVERSEVILIGVVTAVAQDNGGEQLAHIKVEDILRGPELRRISLRGSTTDPGITEFSKGTWILAFLRTSEGDGSYVAVEGDHGVMVVGRAGVNVTRDLVKRAIGRGKEIQLGDIVQDLHVGTRAPPRVLLGSLLEELTLRLTPEEAPLVREIACDAQGSYFLAAQLWSISQAGSLKLSNARRCLEGIVRDGAGQLRIAAVEALGDIGSPRSAWLLISLLPRSEPEPGARRGAVGFDGDERNAPEEEDGDTQADQLEEPEDATPQTVNDDHLSLLWGEGRTPPSAALKEIRQARRERILGTRGSDPAPDDQIKVRGERGADPLRRRSDAGLTDAALLALGKIRSRKAVAALFRIAQEGDDLALQSTAVHALGLIGTAGARSALTTIRITHPNGLIRDQAQRTLQRLRGQDKR